MVNLHAISGHPLLIRSAIEAAKQWTYSPYLLNGEHIEVETTIHADLAWGEKPPVEGDLGANPGGGFIGAVPSDAPGAPKAATPRRIRVSSGVSQALLVTKVAPLYPSEARDQRIEGTVLLQAAIAKKETSPPCHCLAATLFWLPPPWRLLSSGSTGLSDLSGNPIEMETQTRSTSL